MRTDSVVTVPKGSVVTVPEGSAVVSLVVALPGSAAILHTPPAAHHYQPVSGEAPGKIVLTHCSYSG